MKETIVVREPNDKEFEEVKKWVENVVEIEISGEICAALADGVRELISIYFILFYFIYSHVNL